MKSFFITFGNVVGIILYMGTAVALAEMKKASDEDLLKEWADETFEFIDLISDKKMIYTRYFRSATTKAERDKWAKLAHEAAKNCKDAVSEYHAAVSQVPVEELKARDIRPSIRHSWCETQTQLGPIQ